MDYTMDLRKYALNRDKFNDVLGGMALFDNIKVCIENEDRANVMYEDLKEGYHLYFNNGGNMSIDWVEIEVTHVYGGVMFYKGITEGHKDFGVEKHLGKNSFSFMYYVYSKAIITKKGYDVICGCELTKIVNDEDIATIGSYSTTLTPKDIV